jgi:hypothetical protein
MVLRKRLLAKVYSAERLSADDRRDVDPTPDCCDFIMKTARTCTFWEKTYALYPRQTERLRRPRRIGA